MKKNVVIIILALASFITVDAQSEVIGGCVKKDGMTSGIIDVAKQLLEQQMTVHLSHF